MSAEGPAGRRGVAAAVALGIVVAIAMTGSLVTVIDRAIPSGSDAWCVSGS